jgi:glutathione synthase/RimK-type ligase-like ATP-grasp enzyme
MTDEMIERDAELSIVQAFIDRPTEGLKALVLEGEAAIGSPPSGSPASRLRASDRSVS